MAPRPPCEQTILPLARLGLGLLAVAAACRFFSTAQGAELDRVRVALLIDGMATRGAAYDSTELHALGVDGLAAVLDAFLPGTAPPQPPATGPSADAVARRLAELDHDDFAIREAASSWLQTHARPQRALLAAAAADTVERRLRIERILASWEQRPPVRLSAYLTGLWAFLEQIHDPPRLNLLARRTAAALHEGFPAGDQLHLLRLCLAGVAHGGDEHACDLLRPLVRHPDRRVATLVVETVGAYKHPPTFLPRLLIDALESERTEVIEAALRFLSDSQPASHRAALWQALKALRQHAEEGLRFQACLPLVRVFHDAQAWSDVIAQTASADRARARTAWNWIGDTRPARQPPSEELLDVLDRFLARGTPAQRRAAAQALGLYEGPAVIERLAGLLADGDLAVVAQVQRALQLRIPQEKVQEQLSILADRHPSPQVRQQLRAMMPSLHPPLSSPQRTEGLPASARPGSDAG